MIGILDLGMGNLASVRSGFERAGAQTRIISDGGEESLDITMATTIGLVLPGVGAFGDAMQGLRDRGLVEVVLEYARHDLPILGICLGMQMLFSTSTEHGTNVGLNLIPGHVQRFKEGYKVPHIGWNSLDDVADDATITHRVLREDYVYFVHSYYVTVDDASNILATTRYANVTVPAIVGRNNIYGTQFHPEKSGYVGEQILRNFVQICHAQAKTKTSIATPKLAKTHALEGGRA